MSNINNADESRVLAWLAQAEASARTELKTYGPTVSSPMYGGASWGFADASTPHPADAPTWLNPVVAAGLAWLGRAFVQADMEVRAVSGKDKIGEVVSDHPAMILMDRPNAIDTFYTFCQAFLVSDVIDGNTYFVKVRKGGNKIHSLWWVPPWDVEIVASESKDADNPVAGFWINIDGMRKWYESADVIHVKDGKDPADALRGLAPLKAGLRSVMTIDRAEMYTQTLMRNCGAIPVMLSPKDEGVEIMPENVATLRGQFRDNQTGFNNGMPVVAPLGLTVQRLGVTPEEMALDKMTVFPVAVVCSLIGTPAMVLGYPDPGKTYSNLAEANYSAQVNGVIPRQDRLAEAIDIQCPELISIDRERLVWNRTKVIALHAPVLERLDSLTKAAGGPILTPDEARSFVSLGALPDRTGEPMRGGAAPVQATTDGEGLPAVAGTVGNIQATALNGAQVTSLVEIANAVATGALPAESARALIGASFPNLTTEQVSAIVGPLIAFEPTTPEPSIVPGRPMLAPPTKSAEREDGARPFGEPIEAKDDMPPKVVGGEQPDDGDYNLPTGKPIKEELIAWFKQQLTAVLGSIPPDMADIPDSFADLADYTDPMASAMTPILAVYWQEGGDKEVGKLKAATGLDLDEWTVVNPKTRAKIRDAAFAFCDATNKTTSLELTTALSRLRDELTQGIVEQGDTLVQLRKRVQSVFDNAEDYRAQRIAASEASRAVHAAQEAADMDSGVVVGLEWLLSADACPLCQAVNDKVKRVKLGQRFAEVGTNATYKDVRFPPIHPGCQCSVTSVLAPEYGGPENPVWGDTLIQPGSDGMAQDVKPETPRPIEPSKPTLPPIDLKTAPIEEALKAYTLGDEKVARILDLKKNQEDWEAATKRLAQVKEEVSIAAGKYAYVSSLLSADAPAVKEAKAEHATAKKALKEAKAALDKTPMPSDALAAILRPIRPAAVIESSNQPDVAKRATELAEKFLTGVVAESSQGEKLRRTDYFKITGERAWQRNRTIALTRNSTSPVVVHEWGHRIETDLPEINQRAIEFREYRLAGEAQVSLKKLFPKADYQPDETGAKDRFDEVFGDRAWYVGKKYPANESSEIISMGLEQLYRDPYTFAAKDPEYCKFILGVLDGSLR